jgi:asparagine synthase (glutamine-hydrolysing)
MSAIAGIYHQNHEPVSREHIHAMMGSLEQFPADDVRVYKKDHIFLGCHAQWITPESIGEVLPFYDNERKLAITADAIIDNRKDLFNTLGVRQSVRTGMSDSELILLAYEKWEEDCPKHLVGDFAFVIWDERKRKLLAARDFSGSRTLYYLQKDNKIAFCSTMEALLTLPHFCKTLNEEWLAEYLTIQSMIDSVNVTNTVYKNVKQIPPAHTLVFDDYGVRITRYCTVRSDKKLRMKNSEEYVEAFRHVFQEAVDSRLRTHRKVGSQLSGGLDSGSVASLAARSLERDNKRLHTYSYTPENNFVDWTPKSRIPNETPYIRSTLDFIGNSESNILDFNNENALTVMDDWLDIMEMPYKFFENSFWVKGIFEKAQAQGVGILLNGARGNFSISWGSALDYYATLLKKVRLISLIKEVNQFSIHTGITNKNKIFSLIGKKAFPFVKNLTSSSESYYFPPIVNQDFANRYKVNEKLESLGVETNKPRNIYKIRSEHFQQEYIWNTTSTSNSKLSLRYSLWNRDPTNDLRVIKFCLSVPENQYVQNGVGRALIRNAMKGHLPDDIRLNQRHRGIQGADWLHRLLPNWKEFIEELTDLIKEPSMGEYLNLNQINNWVHKYQKPPLPNQAFDPELRSLMRSLIVYRFMQRHIERR